MAKSVLDIVIKLSKQGGADKETVTGLVKVKSAIMDAAAVAGTFVAAGYAINKAYQATGGVFLDLAGKVRDTARATGLNAEESSKLIQVTDDLGVSYETLAKAIKSSADTTDFSIAGLAKASEEYLKITDANERATYAQKLYGKAWVDMVGVLEKGPDVIQKNSDAISKSLILTEKEIRLAEENRIAIDNLQDTATAYAATIGAKVVPAATQLVEGLVMSNDLFTRQHEIMASGEQTYSRAALYMAAIQMQQENTAGALDSATVSYTAWAEAAEKAASSAGSVSDAMADAEEKTKAMSAANTEFLGTLNSFMSTETSYQNTLKTLTQERMDLEAEKQDLLAQGYSEEGEKIAEVNAKLDENSAKAQQNATEHELANKRIMLSLLERKLTADGVLDDKELTWLLDKGVAWGVYSQEVVDETRKALAEVNNLTSGINGIPTTKTFTMVMNMNNAAASVANYGGSGFSGNKRAAGGPVNAGEMYLVGENGPELFVSNQSGKIVPNGGLAGSSGGGGGGAAGGSPISVVLNFNSVVSMADKEEIKKMQPYVFDMIREAQAQGVIR